MRLKNSLRNVKTAWLFQFVHILCQLAVRTVIIKVLTIEYVGLSGLFSNILTMLSVAELGIGEAIIFSLYEPIATDNKKVINSIMKFYQKVYVGVGIFIIIAGFAITPYLSFFIKDMPKDIPNIGFIYMLYVANTAISYFFSYKATFVTATQNNYIVVLNEGITEVLMVVMQIVALIYTHNFILFLAIGIAFVLIRNISITIIANRKYPYIKEHSESKIPTDIFNGILKNTGAMVIHKIGSVVVFATDNLILSKFVGLVSVGIYTNYCVITNAINVFLRKFFNGVTASVGNLAAIEDIEKQEKAFDKLNFLNFWLYSFCGSCLFGLLNPFIGEIWLGKEYLFDKWTVLAIVISFYITGMRCSVQTFKGAKGLYWQNKFMPIAESIINLVVSIILVKKIGVIGVIIGTIISSLCTCVWIEPRVLYRDGFNKSPKVYYWKYTKHFVIFMIMILLTYICNMVITANGILVFILRCLICAIIPNMIIVLLYRRTGEYEYLKTTLMTMVPSNKKIFKKEK